MQVTALIGYRRAVDAADEELATAVRGREGWLLEDRVAVYQPAGAAASVRVRPLPFPTARHRYGAVLHRADGVPERSTMAGSAREAVSWAERLRL